MFHQQNGIGFYLFVCLFGARQPKQPDNDTHVKRHENSNKTKTICVIIIIYFKKYSLEQERVHMVHFDLYSNLTGHMRKECTNSHLFIFSLLKIIPN